MKECEADMLSVPCCPFRTGARGNDMVALACHCGAPSAYESGDCARCGGLRLAAHRTREAEARRVRLEHDPDGGCSGCPLFRVTTARAHNDVWEEASCGAGVRVAYGRRPAPVECPLRSEGVLISAVSR